MNAQNPVLTPELVLVILLTASAIIHVRYSENEVREHLESHYAQLCVRIVAVVTILKHFSKSP